MSREVKQEAVGVQGGMETEVKKQAVPKPGQYNNIILFTFKLPAEVNDKKDHKKRCDLSKFAERLLGAKTYYIDLPDSTNQWIVFGKYFDSIMALADSNKTLLIFSYLGHSCMKPDRALILTDASSRYRVPWKSVCDSFVREKIWPMLVMINCCNSGLVFELCKLDKSIKEPVALGSSCGPLEENYLEPGWTSEVARQLSIKALGNGGRYVKFSELSDDVRDQSDADIEDWKKHNPPFKWFTLNPTFKYLTEGFLEIAMFIRKISKVQHENITDYKRLSSSEIDKEGTYQIQQDYLRERGLLPERD